MSAIVHLTGRSSTDLSTEAVEWDRCHVRGELLILLGWLWG